MTHAEQYRRAMARAERFRPVLIVLRSLSQADWNALAEYGEMPLRDMAARTMLLLERLNDAGSLTPRHAGELVCDLQAWFADVMTLFARTEAAINDTSKPFPSVRFVSALDEVFNSIAERLSA
jgi:hypothetical protein